MSNSDQPASPPKPTTPLDEIGGEPLDGSGFEQETPEPEFSDKRPDQR